ncbi:hypothetical protein [Thermoleptolyngbya sichuanensis]|nr:hypothetical protein [Thermoleptolyngbya sichuanensis]
MSPGSERSEQDNDSAASRDFLDSLTRLVLLAGNPTVKKLVKQL